jgi:hypothetical protein
MSEKTMTRDSRTKLMEVGAERKEIRVVTTQSDSGTKN